jgi:hypothetical protein
MIKRILMTVFTTGIISLQAVGQCVPDVTITTPGIYPDSATGLPAGTVGTPYNEVIQVKVLTDTTLAGLPVTITSITIDQVIGMAPGLTYSCTPANCVFPGGSNGCMQISGTPTQAGSFPLTVNLIIDADLSGIPFQQPQTVDYYVIDINASTGVATLSANLNFGIVNLQPNPAFDYTDLTYSTPVGGDFRLSLYDLLGKKVSEQLVRGFAGNNTVRIKTSSLNAGVYMMTLGNGSSVVTRKVVVSKR